MELNKNYAEQNMYDDIHKSIREVNNNKIFNLSTD